MLATRPVAALDLKAADIPREAAGKLPLLVEWNGSLEPQETGEFNLGVSAEGAFAGLWVDGRQIAQEFVMDQPGLHSNVGHIHLERGKRVGDQSGLLADQTRARSARSSSGQGTTRRQTRRR